MIYIHVSVWTSQIEKYRAEVSLTNYMVETFRTY